VAIPDFHFAWYTFNEFSTTNAFPGAVYAVAGCSSFEGRKEVSMRRISAMCVLTAGLFVLCIGTGVADVRLSEVSGVVEVYQAHEKAWKVSISGAQLMPGDRVRCHTKAAAALVYDDGTTLRLKGATMLQIIVNGYRLRYGSTWVKVVKQGTRFRTLTPNAVVSVRGTIYAVSTRRVAEFDAGLGKATSSADFLSSLPRAHIAGTSLLLAMLDTGIPTTGVRVYRGKVHVAPATSDGVPSGPGSMVIAGHSLTCAGSDLSGDLLLDVDDYKEWGIGYRRYFMPDGDGDSPLHEEQGSLSAPRGTGGGGTTGAIGNLKILQQE